MAPSGGVVVLIGTSFGERRFAHSPGNWLDIPAVAAIHFTCWTFRGSWIELGVAVWQALGSRGAGVRLHLASLYAPDSHRLQRRFDGLHGWWCHAPNGRHAHR